ncbi:MAG: hypothetical protein ACLSUT_02285 [Christensenellales bacterium]
MIKAIPLLVSLLTVFTAGSLPLKDVGNELIKTDEQQQVMLAGRAETDVSVKPFEKEPRAGKNVQSDKNYTISDSADGKSDSAKNDATAPETKKSVNTENPADRKNAADNNSAERNAGRSTSEDGAVFDADAIFEYRKEELNKRYEKMFEMKSRLDEINKESDALWREYYAMRESYDRQYKRIVSEWARDSLEMNK